MTEDERPDKPEEERPETPEERPPETDETPAAPEAADEQPEEATPDPAAEAPEQPDAGEPEQPEAAEPEQPPAAEPAAPEQPVAEETETGEAPAAPEPAEARPPRGRAPAGEQAEEVVPGADLEPDLVLDDQPQEEDRYADAAERYPAAEEQPSPEAEEAPAGTEEPRPATPMTLAADARYTATGKRKTSVARVILSPGDGSYTVNGRPLEEFFPRPTLQKAARQPLATAGYDGRMNVVAKLHGGGVSSQAGALRHGIARALVGADPNLRGDLKRRGFLTRDPRVKERKKAGLKKARKRPQFSKR